MSKEPRKKIKVEPLEPNRDPVAALTEEEAESAKGGWAGAQGKSHESRPKHAEPLLVPDIGGYEVSH